MAKLGLRRTIDPSVLILECLVMVSVEAGVTLVYLLVMTKSVTARRKNTPYKRTMKSAD